MRRAVFLLLLLFAVCVCSSIKAAGSAESDDKDMMIVAGYLPEYRFYADLEFLASRLTDLILFSVAPDRDGNVQSFLSDENIKAAQAARAANSKLRLLVSVGGAGRSLHFQAVAQDGAKRRRFVLNLLNFCRKHGFDGVDFDWEAPQDQNQVSSYVRLLHEAHAKFGAALIVSVALHPGQSLGGAGFESVNRINLMTYDLSFGNRALKHHGDLGQTNRAISMLIRAGAPKEKIVVGIPAYGRGGSEGRSALDVRTYSELMDDMMVSSSPGGAPEKRGDENLLSVLPPTFRTRDNYNGFYFDCQLSAQRKTAQSKYRGLGGVFIWEVGQDKLVSGVSLTEAVMLVANGTKKLTNSEMTWVDAEREKAGGGVKTAEHMGGVKERVKRRRREKEELKKARLQAGGSGGGGSGEL